MEPSLHNIQQIFHLLRSLELCSTGMVIALMALMMKDKMTGRKLDEKDRL